MPEKTCHPKKPAFSKCKDMSHSKKATGCRGKNELDFSFYSPPVISWISLGFSEPRCPHLYK